MKKFLLSLLLAVGLMVGPAIQTADAGKSFGGSDNSSTPPSRPPPAASPSPSRPAPSSPAPSRPTPASPSTPSPSRPQPAPAASARPKTNFDSGAARSAKIESSRGEVASVRSKPATAYQPRPTYVSPSGVSRPIVVNDPVVIHLRSNYSYNTYSTRSTRYTTVFGPGYGSYYHTTYVYSDPINPFFYGYMISRMAAEDRAMWAYNHRREIDDARYREMCAHDALLDARVRELESRGVARNAAYCPPGVDLDLQYSDDYVKAATGVDQAEADVRAAEARLSNAENERDYVEGNTAPNYVATSHHHMSFFAVLIWLTVFIVLVFFFVALIRFMTQD